MNFNFKNIITAASPSTLSQKLLDASMGTSPTIKLNTDDDNKEDNNKNGVQRISLGINLESIKLRPVADFNFDQYLMEFDSRPDSEKALLIQEKKIYTYDALNKDQKVIYDYITANPQSIITIQAGPGCGKSFLLKTIGHTVTDIPANVIIYKHDLLHSFRHCARRNTVAKFVMDLLDINFKCYESIDYTISSNITAYQFMTAIVSCVRIAKLGDLKGSFVFLDEYTIISKPILLMVLMTLEYHKIGTIICGDMNQLQNIHNSRHAIMSSHFIAKSFSAREFNLFKNERCCEKDYNDIIDHFAQYSSDKKLDEYAFAIVATIFMEQTTKAPKYNDIHIAATHQELANLQHMLVCNESYPTNFYMLNQSHVQENPTPILQYTVPMFLYEMERQEIVEKQQRKTPGVGKFLPYIPLVIGARYYYNKHSEFSQGVLVAIDTVQETVAIRPDNDPNSIVVLKKTNSDEVIFEQHLNFLMDNGNNRRQPGHIYSYPIYPANFMSVHKCQGCTITENLDLLLHKTTYQGLYVALSRVTTAKQIVRVTFPNQVSHLVSTIVNFPEHLDGNPIPISVIHERMINYKFYQVTNMVQYANWCCDFIKCTSKASRIETRKVILNALASDSTVTVKILSQTPEPIPADYNQVTISRIIKYNEIFLALASIEAIDSNVWIHEFMIHNRDMEMFLPKNKSGINMGKMPDTKEQFKPTTLCEIAGWNKSYPLEVATTEYIKSRAKLNYHTDPKDVEARAKYCIESPMEGVFLETTEFCARIYKRYMDNETIDMPWLIDELNRMLEHKKMIQNPVKNNDGRQSKMANKRKVAAFDYFGKRQK